ncbi:capsular polysaccharide biosynthesis protein [Ureibacillus xyleni]|uniref:Capsular polysaccharide biosynthesis protein n=1 Tax=Ureibacillus xyleni TaxID=614648 RepID=A0A285RN20_9BACL|nr:Wzz/FepE/Etk N-terminal domain-containing protein [Ureibacillus xyleni]SOB93677.1 capsular polysaccharide biosynthesis protein [Ureibacillus xyleni]
MNSAFDFKQIYKILFRRLIVIISILILTISISIIFSLFIVKPTYQAQSQILINQKEIIGENDVLYQFETDIQLIKTYSVIIKSPAILDKVVSELKLNMSVEELAEKVSLYHEENSKVVNLIVEDDDPNRAVQITNKVADVFKEEIPKLINVDNINILSIAKMDDKPSPVKPNIPFNLSLGVLFGILLSVGVVFLLEIMDTTIKSEDDIEQFKIPIMGVVTMISSEDIHGPYSSQPSRRS